MNSTKGKRGGEEEDVEREGERERERRNRRKSHLLSWRCEGKKTCSCLKAAFWTAVLKPINVLLNSFLSGAADLFFFVFFYTSPSNSGANIANTAQSTVSTPSKRLVVCALKGRKKYSSNSALLLTLTT